MRGGKRLPDNTFLRNALQLVSFSADDQLCVRRCEEQSAHRVSVSFDHNITVRENA